MIPRTSSTTPIIIPAAATSPGRRPPCQDHGRDGFHGLHWQRQPVEQPVAIGKAAKPNSTPAGARPATVVAPATCGMKVPRSPHAPLHSKRKRRVGGVAVGSTMRFSYQKRTPFPIERCFGTRNDPRRRFGEGRLWVDLTR